MGHPLYVAQLPVRLIPVPVHAQAVFIGIIRNQVVTDTAMELEVVEAVLAAIQIIIQMMPLVIVLVVVKPGSVA